MEKALANLALKTAEAGVMPEQQEPAPKTTPAPPSALKGVNQSLLERVGFANVHNKLSSAHIQSPAKAQCSHNVAAV